MKKQLISGLTLASTRADMSARAQRLARERKILAANVETIGYATDSLKAIVKKAKAAAANAEDVRSYGSIEADGYYSTDHKVNLHVNLTIRALSLQDMAWKMARGAAAMNYGFEFAETEERTDKWNAGLSVRATRKFGDNVTAYLTMDLRLKDADEGATCELVQVGVKTKEVIEPIMKLVCH